MEYFVYTAGAVTLLWIGYTIINNTHRNVRRFWREQIQTRALFSRTFGKFFMTVEERNHTRLDADQKHVDKLLQDARESRDRLLALSQWFSEPGRTTNALDNLPGRTSRQLVDELAKIEQDIAKALGQFQLNLKASIASYTRGANLLERFEAMQGTASMQKDADYRYQETKEGKAHQVVIETVGLESINDTVIYMMYYPAGGVMQKATGAQVKQAIASGSKLNQDFFICGPASSFDKTASPDATNATSNGRR